MRSSTRRAAAGDGQRAGRSRRSRIAVTDEGRGIPAAALPDLRALLSRAGRGRHGLRRRPRAGRGQGARRGLRQDIRVERHRTGDARRVHTAQFLTLCVAPVYPTWAMPRRDGIAERMADAVLKRLVTRKIIDVKDEKSARTALRQVVLENSPPRSRSRSTPQAAARSRQGHQGLGRRLSGAVRQGQGEAGPRAGIHPVMRMSRERLFYLADLVIKALGTTAR